MRNKEGITSNGEQRAFKKDRLISWPVRIGAGATALALTAPFAIAGISKGIDRQLSTDSQVETGETSLKKFYGDFERTCVTAATMTTENASNKLNANVGKLNVPGVWNEQMMDADTGQQFCIDGVELDPILKADTVNIDLPSDAIEHHIEIESSTPTEKFGTAWAGYEIGVDMLKGAPGPLRDIPAIENIRETADGISGTMRSQLLTLMAQSATDKCADVTFELGRPWIEKSIINYYKRGYDLALDLNKDIDMKDVKWSVSIDGTPISEVETLPMDSNLSESAEEIKKYMAEKGTFEVGEGQSGECKATDDIKKQLEQAGL